jgi:hypothetical protein
MKATALGLLLLVCSLVGGALGVVDKGNTVEEVSDEVVNYMDASDADLIDVIDEETTVDQHTTEDEEGEEGEEEVESGEDVALLETEERFGPFQAAANVMPYNMAVDPGHNFMNPFIRGYNPAYDGYTPQPGGMLWNNPNGPNWSPFHWSAPPSYWSVYPPQYASHYVSPHLYHAPPAHQFYGPNYNGQHNHYHSPDARFPYGSRDPHIFGPHLDWPFGALTSDMDHVPGMGTGVNAKLAFPQFVELSVETEDHETDEDGFEGTDEETSAITSAVDSDEFEVDSNNGVIPHKSTCVNCAYTD